MNNNKKTTWRLSYNNTNKEVSEKFYWVFIHAHPGFYAIVNPDSNDEITLEIISNLSNVDFMMLVRDFFKEHPEFIDGCERLDAQSTLTVIENMDMKPLFNECLLSLLTQ